ncbi:MAG: Fe-S cluster assembly protein IscX [Zoogloeaceae bacterium]|jgi:FeS assembly protein IscX|nr:Fe-S cluster assembly protein IscX [Zoogloeaceae bacterium]
MKQWHDIPAIARALADAHPRQDPARVNFIDLRNWILALPDFNGNPAHCGEKILEAIQQAWMDEAQD